MREPPARTIVRIVLIIVAVAICLYLIYQVRRPLTWLFISAFLAIALSGPVNGLTRHMRRGIAIAIVYVGLLLVPIGLIALIVPPFITEGNRFAENLPQYSREVTDFVERQRTPARAEQGLRHHAEAPGGGRQAPIEARRRRHHPARRGHRDRQLAVRAHHDPGAHRVHAGQRATMGRRGTPAATTRATRAPGARPRPDRRRRGRLRGGRDVHRVHRRRGHLRRAHDPRRALRRAAGGDRRPLLADTARGSHDRGGADRAWSPCSRTSRPPRSSGRSGRSSTSSSRTT